jgi:hypothetical protein
MGAIELTKYIFVMTSDLGKKSLVMGLFIFI